MKKVLILMGRYLPGYKDGGPVRTIKNLTDIFGKEYDIRIMCKDRDHGDLQQYPNIFVDTYNKVGNANVYYVKNEKFKFKNMLNEIKKVDIVYCCGPYNDYAIKAMVLKRLGFFKMPLVIASMGSFSKGALSIKSKKKMIFLNIMKKLGFFKKIVWSVTSVVEKKELKEVIGENVKCIIAEDLPRTENFEYQRNKKKENLKIIFLSRICEMKNLLGAIDILISIKDLNIQFDIYGNKEDIDYWEKCERKLYTLPANIKWKYCGECDSEKVLEIFAKYDIFLFPTLGENFGHVINEALIAGCIPIISNNTPWNDIEENNCGKVIPITCKNAYIEAIKYFYNMDNESYKKYIINLKKYIYEKNRKSLRNTGYYKIFNQEDNL